MKKAVWLSIVWCNVLGIAGYLPAEADEGARGSVRERFQEAWKSRESLPEPDNPMYVLYSVAFSDLLGTKMSVSNLMDRDFFIGIMRTAAAEAGVTNFTANDLQRIYTMHTNAMRMLLIAPNLPLRIEDWPPPDLSWTNEASGLSSFIKEHGWSMYNAEAPFAVGMGFRTEPITGLPWREISGRRFPAVTYNGILFVVLEGFGPDSGGVAWNPQTNRFPVNISGFLPLGRGWYSWQQADTPTVKRYEGEVAQPEQTGGANGSQSTRAQTNSGTTGPRR